MYYLPNFITILRIALVPWLIVTLQNNQYTIALVIFVIAGLSDALDGILAKRFNAMTKLGGLLDPIADKALLVSSFIMLTLMQIVPFWLTVTVVFRDIVIVGGYLLLVLFFSSTTAGQLKTKPLLVSKLNTFLQISFIFMVLCGLAIEAELYLVLAILSYAILLTSVVSGAAYVLIGFQEAVDENGT